MAPTVQVRVFDELGHDTPHSYRRLVADFTSQLEAAGWAHDVVRPDWPIPGTRADLAHVAIAAVYRQLLYPVWARHRFLPGAINVLIAGGLAHLALVAPPACPLAVFCHDVFPFVPAEQLGHRLDYGGGLRRFYLTRVLRPGLRRADLIIAPSEATRRDLVQRVGVDPERTAVIASRVDPAMFHPGSPAEARDALGLPPDRPVVLAVVSPERRKNVGRLLLAFRRLTVSPPPQLLLLGHLAPRDRRLLAALNLGDRVTRRADLDTAGVVACYRAAGCLAHVSLYEGFGYPLLEAMACGCPVVCSDRGSIPEVVAGAALVVDAADPGEVARGLQLVLTDGELAADLRARGLERARRFAGAPAYTDALRSLTGGAGARSLRHPA